MMRRRDNGNLILEFYLLAVPRHYTEYTEYGPRWCDVHLKLSTLLIHISSVHIHPILERGGGSASAIERISIVNELIQINNPII